VAYFYHDPTATGTDSGADWANACVSLTQVLALGSPPVAGDTIYLRANSGETTVDTVAATASYVLPNDKDLPVKLIGVKTGTTNTGSGVVTSDLCDRSVDMPVLQVTGSGNDLRMNGCYQCSGVKFSWDDNFNTEPARSLQRFISCVFVDGDNIWSYNNVGRPEFFDCDVNGPAFTGQSTGTQILYSGGLYRPSDYYMFGFAAGGNYLFTGVDMSGTTSSLYVHSMGNPYTFRNCLLPSIAIVSSAINGTYGSLTFIGCKTAVGAVDSDSSIPDYNFYGYYGTVALESGILRTGGATDETTANTDGSFSYVMTPYVDRTSEGVGALVSPEMAVWVAGGSSTTLNIYIAVDTLLNEDEVWVEWYTPDSSDSPQHEQTHLAASGRVLNSSTVAGTSYATDWTGTGVPANAQKFSITKTPGYTGWVYAKLHYAKRFASGAVPLYLDPKIEVMQ